MVKVECCPHGRCAGFLGIPRAEFPDAVNLTARLGIRQDGVKVRRLIESEIVHVEMVDVEGMRRERRILGSGTSTASSAMISSQLQSETSMADPNRCRESAEARPSSRRRMNLQSVQTHAANRHFVSQEPRNVSPKRKP